mgnify:CR=1 FL=1
MSISITEEQLHLWMEEMQTYRLPRWNELPDIELYMDQVIQLFENKYGEKVKVYTIGEFSKEICGGPHVTNTAKLGHFKIKKEEASSAGVRRIKAILD